MGLPTKKGFSDFLKNILNTSDYKFRYYAAHNTEEFEGQARAWAKIGMDAGVQLEKFSAGDVTDLRSRVQTAFEFRNDPIPDLPTDMLSEILPPDPTLTNNTIPDPPKMSGETNRPFNILIICY